METISSIRKLLPSVPSTLKDALVETNQPLLDPRLPSVKAAQWLIERYRLDNDYLPEIVSMLLGRPPGGGQADEIIWPRGDDTGLAVFIPKVPYNSTQSQWLDIYSEAVYPSLLSGRGRLDKNFPYYEAVEKAITNPLLDVDVSGANGALINVSGGSDMTLEEARKVVEAVSQKLDENAKVIWGAQIYEDLPKMIRTMLIVTGVRSEQIFGREKMHATERKKEIESELGIEFVD